MLSISDLEIFAENHKDSRPNLENFYMVASEDKLADLHRDTVNAGDKCSLVVLMPSHDPNNSSEDNRRMRNNISFMVLKKTDKKAGAQEIIRVFKLCQEEIRVLLVKILDLYDNEGNSCVFRKLELNSGNAVPVPDFIGSNGYDLTFSTLTEL